MRVVDFQRTDGYNIRENRACCPRGEGDEACAPGGREVRMHMVKNRRSEEERT